MKPKFALRNAALSLATFTLAITSVPAANLFWDIDGATAGAGGASPAGAWTTGGTTWSTDANGTVATSPATTLATDDLFFSAGVNATGAYTIDLTDTQNAKSLTFQDGTATISGVSGVITLGGTGGKITINNGLSANIGANTGTIIGGSVGLTKLGFGSLTLNGTLANTFTGGLAVNCGTLALNFANMGTPTDIIASGNTLALGGGRLSVTGKSTGATSQTLGDVSVNPGGGSILINPSGGTSTTLTLGTLTATASGGSLLAGKALSAGLGTVAITTTTDKDANGIYGGRTVFADGTASTGYDWATNTGGGGPNYTLSAFSSYTALPTSGGAATDNYNMTASTTLTAGFSANTLKMAPGATSAVILDLGTNTLTLDSGGILFTGTGTLNRIQNGTLTAGAGSGYNLIVHSFNSQFVNSGGGNGINNAGIRATIADNGANPVALVVESTPGGTAGMLHLAGINTFTGGIFLNNAVLNLNPVSGVGGVAAALNNNTINVSGYSQIHIGNTTTASPIVLNNGAVLDFRLNTNTFTTSGSVTGDGGITLGQAGGGATNLNFNNTANNFTGPVRFAVTAQSGNLTVNSFADSSTLGEGNITFGVSGTVPHNFNYGTGAIAALTLNNRRFDLAGSQAAMSINNNSPQAFTINTGLLVSGTGTKTLTLGGNGVGLSSFAGDIGLGSATTLNITKSGSGTWVLSGNNSYNGTTTVSAGALLINNTIGSGTGTSSVSVSVGTLGGNGTISGTVTIGNNTGSADAILAPGNSIDSIDTGALAFGSDGRYAVEVNGTLATSDQTNVTGTVTINAATTLAVTVAGALSPSQKYFIVVNDDAMDAVSGTFATFAQDAVVGNFGGTDLKISYTGDSTTSALTGGNDIVLYTDPSGGAYDSWATLKGLTGLPGSSTDPAKDADPDNDGNNNLSEFAFDGNPLSGVNDGKILGKVATVGGDQVMTLTLPVRAVADFTVPSGVGDLLSLVIDGIYYRIEGDVNLSTFADTITEVTSGEEVAIQAAMPALTAVGAPGWTYRTFRHSGTVPATPKAFLRAKASETP